MDKKANSLTLFANYKINYEINNEIIKAVFCQEDDVKCFCHMRQCIEDMRDCYPIYDIIEGKENDSIKKLVANKRTDVLGIIVFEIAIGISFLKELTEEQVKGVVDFLELLPDELIFLFITMLPKYCFDNKKSIRFHEDFKKRIKIGRLSKYKIL